jgi:hypothetical protein
MQDGHSHDLCPSDRAVLDFIQSCDDLSEEMSENDDLVASGGSTTMTLSQPTEKVRAVITPRVLTIARPPTISSKISVVDKELQILELHKWKIQLLQNIDACKQSIAVMQEKYNHGQTTQTTPGAHATVRPTGVGPTPNVHPPQGTVDISNLMNLFPSHVLSVITPSTPNSKGEIKTCS